MAIVLLLLVAGWITYSLVIPQSPMTARTDVDDEKVAKRRAAVRFAPESAGVHEALGDALREAGRYQEAMGAYETAKGLAAQSGSGGAGMIGGSGLDNKIRLLQLDLRDEREKPRSYVAQVARRESVCRQCSTINAPNETHCTNCGKDLPTNTFLETWQRDDIRVPILREAGQGAVMIVIVLIALYLASWMPLEVKGVLLLSTIIVLVWKGLRAITDK